jgi:hypothetical protein
MRQFASGGFRIWNLSLEAKIVYTFFGIFSLLALVSSALFYEQLVGKTGSGAYYAGGAAPPTVNSPGGPTMEMPDEPKAMTVAMPYSKLLETSHFHLFTVPVFLLIVAHLFMLTGLSSRAKAGWILAAWSTALVHLAAPWIVRYGGAGWAPLYAGSGGALGVTSGVLTVYPIYAMWRGRPKGEPAEAKGG